MTLLHRQVPAWCCARDLLLGEHACASKASHIHDSGVVSGLAQGWPRGKHLQKVSLSHVASAQFLMKASTIVNKKVSEYRYCRERENSSPCPRYFHMGVKKKKENDV